MAEQKKSDAWLLALYALLLLAGLALLAAGVARFVTADGEVWLLGAGALAVIVTAALYPIAAGVVSPTARPDDADPAAADPAAQREMVELLRTVSERLMISDAAKRIAYREQDRAALRRAITDEINSRDYEAALALVEEMASTYGYRLEAEQFRAQIEEAREADMNARIDQLVANLDKLIINQQWDRAMREAAAINRMYPDSPRTETLRQYVKDAYDKNKHELEREFLDARNRDDVERAMELLKLLDRYLTEEEAEPFREAARGVISTKRNNLGIQFKLAVHDKEWVRAVSIGEEIVRDFPNTKMAAEIRGMLDALRQRAAGEQAARPHDVAAG